MSISYTQEICNYTEKGRKKIHNNQKVVASTTLRAFQLNLNENLFSQALEYDAIIKSLKVLFRCCSEINDYKAIIDKSTHIIGDIRDVDGINRYRKLEDMVNAAKYYQYVIDNYPGTEKAKTAANYVDIE